MRALASFAGSTRISIRSTPHTSNPTRVSADRGFRGQPLAGPVGPDPVADLESIVADPAVQTGAANHAGLGGVEERIDVVLVEVEPTRKARSRSTFSSRDCGSSCAQGIQGRRWSRLPSTASLSSGASAGSQQRTTIRSVSIRYGAGRLAGSLIVLDVGPCGVRARP